MGCKPSAQDSNIGEKPAIEVEQNIRARCQKPPASGGGDRGKALGDIGSAGKDDRLNAGPDRALRRAGIVTAIEDELAARRRHRRAGGIDQPLEPARAGINSGARRAQQRDGLRGYSRGLESRDRVVQRMDDDDGSVGLPLVQAFAFWKTPTHFM